MEVTIKSSSMVLPADTTPAGLLPLSECDQIMAPVLVPVIYIYKPNDSSLQVNETLVNSLSRALVHFYPLAGRLRSIEGGRFELNCNAMGAQFVEAESLAKQVDIDDFTPFQNMQQLVPEIDYTRPIDELPVLQVQLTRFCCGGLAVGVAISHIVADGTAMMLFTSSLAKLTRGENIDVVPFHDRTVLRPSESLVPPRFHHVEFDPYPLVLGQFDHCKEQNKETSCISLELTKTQVDQLKKIANEEMIIGGHRPYTSFEVVTAHLWRCLCKARGSHDCQPTLLRLAADGRHRLKPPLPEGFFGNGAFPLVTDTCLSSDLVSKPLCYATGKLRKSIEKFTDEYIKSTLDFIKIQSAQQKSKKKVFMGNPNLSIASWTRFPLYEMDFGWRRPALVKLAILVSDGHCVIMPTAHCDGSLVVALRLQSAHVSTFRELFYNCF